MSLLDELRGLGVNVDEGLKRIMGNEALYKRLLGSFVKTLRENSLAPDFDAADCTEAIEKTHAIKGTSGNLSITPLYEAYTEIVNELRAGNPEKARALLVDILPVQEQIVQCIENNSES
ncbi:MAG: hypothetical protein NC094_10025 [Bacteroidales bacterium]|nr:hypothetical protein [Lachnoclostridium sp.]MCM1383256.1 hypothetical protein [Lachnoclostridium sp.]MCM1465744.1 hypothetical protein [Bacteroidales bacterium]